MRRKNDDLKIHQALTSISDFMEAYNRMIPSNFPQATVKMLERFKALHPILFKYNDQWSIDRHRKRLMDWIPSYLRN